jgi:hypothetical protein
VGARETRLGQQGSRWAIGMGRKEGEPVREIKGKGIFFFMNSRILRGNFKRDLRRTQRGH